MFKYSYILYIIQLIFFVLQAQNAENPSFVFISPSFITVLYTGLNFTVGEYLISKGFGLTNTFYKLVYANEYLSIITAFFLFCNFLIFYAIPKEFFAKNEKQIIIAKQKHTLFIFFSFFIIVSLNFFNVDLSIIGGQGNFNYPMQLALTIPVSLLLASKKNVFRGIIYLTIVGIFTVAHFSSKREILYIIITFVLCEVVAGNIKLDFSFKKILLYAAMVIGIIYIILVSSILRGYGNYNVSGPIDAIAYVPKYVKEDFFINAFSSNIESSTVFAHASNSAKYVFSGKEDLLWGSTLFKVLFLAIPRSVFPDKPKSMIDIYTGIYDPSFRSKGGSYPILLYSELLWNFYIFCLPLIFLFYRFFNKLCFKAFHDFRNQAYSYKSLSVFFLLITLIQYVRGSGLELWLIYYIIVMPIFYIVSKLLKIKKQMSFPFAIMPQKVISKFN